MRGQPNNECKSFFFRLPLAEILILVGFLMVYIVEEIAHYFVDRWDRKQTSDKTGSKNDNNAEGTNGPDSAATSVSNSVSDLQNVAYNSHGDYTHEEFSPDLFAIKEKSIKVTTNDSSTLICLFDFFETL